MSSDGRDLEALLSAAAAAAPGDRIAFRDSIAAYGSDAIPPMTPWLRDQRLGAFAVRVLSRIGREHENVPAVREALQSVDPDSLIEAVARDVREAIGVLLPARSRDGNQRARPEQWSGDRSATRLEWRFHEAMLEIFTLAGEATRRRRPDGTIARGYWASYFLRGVRNHGGLDYAHQLLQKEGTTDGFERLKKEQRLDLTVEALVLRPENAGLFTDTELSIASRRIGGLRPHGERMHSADAS